MGLWLPLKSKSVKQDSYLLPSAPKAPIRQIETVGKINKLGYSLLVAISAKLRVLKIGQSYTKLSLDIQLIAK